MRVALLATAAGLVLALLAAETMIRVAFARPALDLGELGRWIRRPERYADGNSDDDHWKLVCRLGGEAALADPANADPVTGWTGTLVAPRTYEHADESAVGARELVLLYGDSFAGCATPVEQCFQSILAQSDLGDRFALLNYGVGGFGLDQTYLLMKQSLDRFAAQNPIVVFSLMVESDFDRSVLAFRCWPKPRLELEGDRLVASAPVELGTRAYLALHPIRFPSYLWRRFLHQDSPLFAERRAAWRGDDAIREEKGRLNLRILAEVRRELESRGLRYFFLAFHAEEGALRPWAAYEWQERMLRDFCAANAVPLLDTRDYLAFASGGDPARCARYYGHGSPLSGHHNVLGNRICFEALRQGIAGDFGAPDTSRLAIAMERGLLDQVPADRASATLLGRSVELWTHGALGAQRAMESREPARVLLRADAAGPTTAVFDLDGTARRFTGQLHTLAGDGQGCADARLRFVIEVDGHIVFDGAVPEEAPAAALDVDLAGARSLALAVHGYRGPGACSWAAISEPRLE